MENISKFVWFQEGPGVRKNQYTENGVKLLNVANLVNGKIDLSTSKRYISPEEAYGKYKHFLVDDGDLIIASSGIQVDYFDKKMGFITKEHLPLCMNTSTIRFKTLNKDVLDINYFMYFMKSEQFKSQLRRLITGSAQLNFGSSHLEKIKMNVPNMEKQRECVQKLNTITSAIEIKKQQLDELDNLIKSQFVEIFGSVNDNNKNFNIETLEDVCETIKDGTHQTPTYTEDSQNGYIFLSSKNVTTGKIDWENVKYIPKELHEKLYKRIKPKKGDILLAKNGTTGIGAIVDQDKVFDIYVSLALLRPKKINPTYLLKAINSQETKEQFDRGLKGIGVPNLHLKEINKVKIIVPPIDLQNQFADFVQHIDKLEFVKIMKRDSATRLEYVEKFV